GQVSGLPSTAPKRLYRTSGNGAQFFLVSGAGAIPSLTTTFSDTLSDAQVQVRATAPGFNQTTNTVTLERDGTGTDTGPVTQSISIASILNDAPGTFEVQVTTFDNN